MMMWFQRFESDRFGWFISDGTVRASVEWDRFCDIRLPIPSIDIQKRYVALYTSLLNNQKVYENSLDDLQLICDNYIENLIRTEEPKILGDYIQQSEERNKSLKIDNLLGISVSKNFITSKSKKERLNLSSYRVVRPREFGYVPETTRSGGKVLIAILDGEVGLIPRSYTVFKVKKIDELLPEYLYLFFKRKEFDRYARFNSWGSARETFDWDEMCRVQLPVPDIKVQESIVTIYHTLETRKRINEELKESLKPLCSILMCGVVKEL
jgi:type I restriction enzyme S subunit